MKPCPHALSLSRVPSKRWGTRIDVHERIESVRAAIDADPGRATLGDLAKAANLSPFHFHRVFKAAYGLTPHAYLHRARMRRAHALLELGHTTVGEACDEVGYASLGSFSRQFKAKFGYSPSQTLRKLPSGGDPIDH